MTALYVNWNWECPMCSDSFMVMPAVVMTAGEEFSGRMLEKMIDQHIDWHCTEFAGELELAC